MSFDNSNIAPTCRSQIINKDLHLVLEICQIFVKNGQTLNSQIREEIEKSFVEILNKNGISSGEREKSVPLLRNSLRELEKNQVLKSHQPSDQNSPESKVENEAKIQAAIFRQFCWDMKLFGKPEKDELRKCATELLEQFSIYSRHLLNEKGTKRFELSLIQEMERILKLTVGLDMKLLEEKELPSDPEALRMRILIYPLGQGFGTWLQYPTLNYEELLPLFKRHLQQHLIENLDHQAVKRICSEYQKLRLFYYNTFEGLTDRNRLSDELTAVYFDLLAELLRKSSILSKESLMELYAEFTDGKGSMHRPHHFHEFHDKLHNF